VNIGFPEIPKIQINSLNINKKLKKMKKTFFVMLVMLIACANQKTFSNPDSTKNVAAKTFDASKLKETKKSKSLKPFLKKGTKITNTQYVYLIEHDSIHTVLNCSPSSDYILEMTAWCMNQNKNVIGLPNDITTANAMAIHQGAKEVTRDIPAKSLKIFGFNPKTCEPEYFINEKEIKNLKLMEYTYDNGVAVYTMKQDCKNLLVDLSPRVPPVKKEDTTRVYREKTDYGGLTVIGNNNIINSNIGSTPTPAPVYYSSYSDGQWQQPYYQPSFYAGGYVAVPCGSGVSFGLNVGIGGFGFSFGFQWGNQWYGACPATQSVCNAVNTYYSCGGTVVNNYITPSSNTTVINNNNSVVVNNNNTNNNVNTVTPPTPPAPPTPEPPIPPVDPGDPVWGSTGTNGNPTNPDWGSTGDNGGGVPPTNPDWGSTGGQVIPPVNSNARKAGPASNTATTKPSTIPATKKTELPTKATTNTVKKVDGKFVSSAPTTKPATAKPAVATSVARTTNGAITSVNPTTKSVSTSVRPASSSNITKAGSSQRTYTTNNSKPSNVPKTASRSVDTRSNERVVAASQRSNDASYTRGNTKYINTGNPNVNGNVVNGNSQTRTTGTGVRSNSSPTGYANSSNQSSRNASQTKSYQQNNNAGSRPQIASNQQRPAYSKGQSNSVPRSSGNVAPARSPAKSYSSGSRSVAPSRSSGVRPSSGGSVKPQGRTMGTR
jgi:hypothetical protein